ncbi:substrate-binding periplasmic protein [Massilia sp. TWP1-3-3]|uniref:substrate-binding periplasmic protein n=1 Tax=Massilia sp. TWP1-3-3 TaxID=2804573 RepID=UPI003CEAFE0A
MVWMMRRCKELGLVLAALALAWPAVAQAQSCSRSISMATGRWEPYAYYDAAMHFTGIDADMVRAIFKEADCQLIELDYKPATRNMTLFEQGDIDLMSGASRTPERLKLAHFSQPYRDETIGLFALAQQAEHFRAIRSFPDFLAAPVSLVAPRAGWYGPVFEREAAALRGAGRLSRFGDFAQGIHMLAAGRVSLMLGDAAAVEHAAVRAGVQVQPLPFWVVQAPVHLMFNRATVPQADVERIDAAIVRLQRRGVLERIRRSYGGQ